MKVNLLNIYFIMRDLQVARQSLDACSKIEDKLGNRSNCLWYKDALRKVSELECQLDAITYVFETNRKNLEEHIDKHFNKIGFK